MFNILIFGGRNWKSGNFVGWVNQFGASNFKNYKVHPPMKQKRTESSAVRVKGDVFVFGGRDENDVWINSVEKYSPFTETWSKVADVCDDRRFYCACAFMDKIIFVGGSKNGTTTSSCLQFDTKHTSWKEIAGMKEARSNAACAVFQERVVVAGGTQ